MDPALFTASNIASRVVLLDLPHIHAQHNNINIANSHFDMANPLASLSDASLNAQRTMHASTEDKPEPSTANLDEEQSLVSKASSSPFQTDVSAFRGSRGLSMSPSKESTVRKTSPNKRSFDFTIHEDEDIEDSTFRFSPHKRSLPSPTSLQNISPSKVPLPESSPYKTHTINVEKPLLGVDFATSHSVNVQSRPQSSESNHSREHISDVRSEVSDDDTRFSAFSAVPNADMTLFATLGTQTPTGKSPRKRNAEVDTLENAMFATPQTSRKAGPASPTPRQNMFSRRPSGDTTNLIDFTDQFNAAGSLNLRASTESNLLAHIKSKRNPSPAKAPRTPAGSHRKLMNLLDFELPPAPTPRSVPSITIRELESMKSTYLSEISSLKASLSGREAEVDSLKKAVVDAERRAGQAMESTREERAAREYAEREKEEWVKKGQEIEQLLKNVRSEVMKSEKEKDELAKMLDEANQQRDDAELRAASASTKTNVAQSQVGAPADDVSSDVTTMVEQRVASRIDERLEIMARELHGVYKGKHEQKVRTLKKTYEVRYDKKCSELQATIDELTRVNEDFQAAKDATLSDTIPEHVLNGNSERAGELQQRIDAQNSEMEGHKAKIAGLTNELSSAREELNFILQELERERVEKGELVAAVDEMLLLQAETTVTHAAGPIEDFRKSMSQPTSLRPSALPTPGQSKIGKPPPSRMMSNIARMGAGRSTE